MQPPLRSRPHQLVAGKREVVHPDRHVPGGQQLIAGLTEEPQLQLGIGHRVRVHLLLMGPHPRHVGVRVDRQPVGPHVDHLRDAFAEALDRLVR